MDSIKEYPQLYLPKLAEHHILSVFKPLNVAGSLYFETSQLANIHSAVNEVWALPIRIHSIAPVPLAELPKLLSRQNSQHTLICHSWARLKKGGQYAGDLAFVDSLEMEEGYANILLVPRLPSLTHDVSGRKRKRTVRNPQALFHHSTTVAAYEGYAASEVTHIGPPKVIDEDTWSYNDEILYKGLCRRKVAVLSLYLSPTEPSETELHQWMDCAYEPIRGAIRQLAHSYNSSSKPPLCTGDRVRVRSTQSDTEELSGTVVFVDDMDHASPTVLVRSDLTDQIQSFTAADLKKEIRVGDLMEVDGGPHSGALGIVVGATGGIMVTLLLGEAKELKDVRDTF